MANEWDIHMEDLSPNQREVAELIGLENYVKLIDAYGAEVIYIPKRDSFERLARNQRIVDRFDGYNYAALAKQFGLTSVTIRRIVEYKRKMIRAAPIAGQISLFDVPESDTNK